MPEAPALNPATVWPDGLPPTPVEAWHPVPCLVFLF